MAAGQPNQEGDHENAEIYRPSPWLRWLYHRFFRHISVDDQWSDVVQGAATKGTVVYVMRSLSLLDFLCLDYLTKRFTLPLVRFVNDLGLWILEPFGKGERRFRFRRQVPEPKAVRGVLQDGQSALLFLRRPPRPLRSQRRGQKLEVDLIKTLVEIQRTRDAPILIVPQTFVWSKLPPQRKPGLIDLIFGPVEWPGRIRVFFQFLFNYRNALLRAGEPFDVAAFLQANRKLDDITAADKIRYALLRRMERERTLVLGPTKKTPTRIQTELIRSPRVRKVIESEARAGNKSVAKVVKRAQKILRRLCADPNPHVISILARLLDWVWSRIYDGIVIDHAGLKKLRNTARDGTLVLMPCHKSHIDYLVLSYVLYKNSLATPLIAAGENLSFWPAGPVLRRGGAFFIRRSFKGKKLYSALVDAYLRRLMVGGFPIEFFIEGGRSRTGKLLTPKFGLLSMIVDAGMKLRSRKVYFAPVSIGYERIVEQKSYVHELSGGDKEKENLGGLLRSTKVLRSKHGRVFVQFGEPLSLDDAIADMWSREQATPLDGDARDLKPRQRRTLVQRIAHQVVYEINRATVATPAAVCATALLIHRRRGITQPELLDVADRVVRALQSTGARLADTLLDEGGLIRADTLEEAIQLFIDSGLVTEQDHRIYSVAQERRIELEFYKNNLLHFFVPRALISSALLANTENTVSRHTLRERVRQLSRLFKYEFMYRADATFEEIFDEALESMLQQGDVDELADHIKIGNTSTQQRLEEARQSDLPPPPPTLGLIRSAGMIRTYFESSLLTLRAIQTLGTDASSKKDWVKETLRLGHRMHLAGTLELRESVSKPKIENALQALRDHGLLRFSDAGQKIEISPEANETDTIERLEALLLSFLQ